MATVYAPICYPPLPVLGFKVPEGGGRAVLALVGSVRDCNPDRVVLKKVVLSG
jgi:pre-rRNA-processing protein TSR1